MCRSCKLPPVPDEDDIIECSRRVTAIVKVTILHKKIKKIDLQVKLIYNRNTRLKQVKTIL